MQHRDTLALEVNVQQQECLVFLLFCVNMCFYLAIKPEIVSCEDLLFFLRKKIDF